MQPECRGFEKCSKNWAAGDEAEPLKSMRTFHICAFASKSVLATNRRTGVGDTVLSSENRLPRALPFCTAKMRLHIRKSVSPLPGGLFSAKIDFRSVLFRHDRCNIKHIKKWGGKKRMYGHKQRAVQEMHGFALCVRDRKYRFSAIFIMRKPWRKYNPTSGLCTFCDIQVSFFLFSCVK